GQGIFTVRRARFIMPKNCPPWQQLCTMVVAALLLTHARGDEAQDAMKQGTLAMNAQKFDEAITCFDKVIRLDPKNARAFSERGFCWLAKHKLDKASADLKEAIQLDPREDSAYSHMGMVYSTKGEYKQAI